MHLERERMTGKERGACVCLFVRVRESERGTERDKERKWEQETPDGGREERECKILRE
jgi:hypothetical protein